MFSFGSVASNVVILAKDSNLTQLVNLYYVPIKNLTV
jgi:hypothetical protein